MLRSARLSASISLVVGVSLAAVAAAAAVPLGDGVIVDSAAGRAYLMAPDGEVRAVELDRGRLIWSAAGEAKPIAAAAGLVIAQAASDRKGSLELVSFDGESGRPGSLRATVDLPEGVEAGLRDGMTGAFRLSAGLEDGALLVAWRATELRRNLRGYLPSAAEGSDPASAEHRSGAVQLDLASGVVSAWPAPVPAAASVDTLPAGAVSGANGNLFASADGRHLVASERQMSDDPYGSYRWTVYDRGTGERLGEHTSISSVAPFVVIDGKLIFVRQRSIRPQGNDVIDLPRQLVALELATGREAWAQAVSDPAFRGPFPP